MLQRRRGEGHGGDSVHCREEGECSIFNSLQGGRGGGEGGCSLKEGIITLTQRRVLLYIMWGNGVKIIPIEEIEKGV